MATVKTTNPVTGEEIEITLTRGWDAQDGYKYNNLFRTSNAEDVVYAVQYMIENGWDGSDNAHQRLKEFLKANGRPAPESEIKEIITDANTYMSRHNIDINDITKNIKAGNIYDDSVSPEEAAFNAYYRDIYSTDPGTLGGDIYNNFVGIAQNQAMNDMALADAQLQQSAMQQAATVKAITDELRAERMEKLRAGMSEAQIANQDMQQLMTNVNTLNQNVADMNLARMQAMQQYDSAQDTAYQAWLENIQTLGQTGSAYAASDAGDLYQQALRIKNKTKKSLNDSLDIARGSKVQ